MADNNTQNTTNSNTNNFTKGMVKDSNESFLGEGVWTHARNAVNNSVEGQVGVIGNEPANRFCTYAPYEVIGAVNIIEDEWVIFSTNDVDCEVGRFDESTCKYTKVVNDPCLNFKKSHLIVGVMKYNYDCTWSVYFDDGLNPSRVLNIDKVPYIEKPKKLSSRQTCVVPEYTDRLDCEAIRLSPLISTPCLSLSKAKSGGILPNGSYQVAIAYSINGIKITDYFTPSNVQSLFSHSDVGGALEVVIDSLDTKHFDEFELVIMSFIKGNYTAHKYGNYSTNTKRILIDKISAALVVIQPERIPLRTPSYERSDNMFEVNSYLIRTGIYTKPDFNYQPQANKIKTKWVATELPADHYIKGGNVTSYLRDEVYSFFIRWVYNTGEKSASYHIPGREATAAEKTNAAGKDAIENTDPTSTGAPKKWQVNETAKVLSRVKTPLYDIGGEAVMEGEMGYWQSTEIYPDNKPLIWGDLCGKNIRHHKMPDNSTVPIYNSVNNTIIVLGVKFEGITHPLDNDGQPIQSIVGYEILRGSREGNKTVIAKGLLSNMGQYTIDPNLSTRTGLYANYPFNDLNIDPFLSTTEVKGGCKGKGYSPMGTFRKDMFSFHSPDTQFRDPFLNPYELKIHGEVSGKVEGSFNPVFKHPQHKLLKDFAVWVSAIVATGVGMTSLKGKKTTTITTEPARNFNAGITSTGATTIVSTRSIINPLTGQSFPVGGQIGSATITSKTEEDSPFANNSLMAKAAGAFTFTYFFGQAEEQALKTIRLMLPFIQYAYQYNAHGFYTEYTKPVNGNRRRKVLDAQYVNPYLQDFGTEYRINNLFRSRYVAIKLEDDIENPTVNDDSRVTIGNLGAWSNPTQGFNRTTSAHYASLKIALPSQYGQLDGIIQIPVSTCVNNTLPVLDLTNTSPILFGGDVYINRYTEKNAFFFFNDWLLGEPDGYEYNYMEHVNVPYPRYWMNSREYDAAALMQPFVNTMYGAVLGGAIAGGILGLFDKSVRDKKIFGFSITNIVTIAGTLLGGIAAGAVSLSSFKNSVLPNDYFHLDRLSSECTGKASFEVKQGYFYIFANGVKDFFCESEINLAQRDWEDEIGKRHYDQYSYTDLQSLFRSDVIKAGNYYKYDYSLSASKMLTNFVSWGSVVPKDFDPAVSASCYSYYPYRAVYSLPTQLELKKDNWKVFLANNYYDFNSKVTTIKGINQSGSIILYEAASADFFAGVDQLQTGNGIKVTIGDGGLFATPLQTTSNAEKVYEYGSCQSKDGVINTPGGLFWISQNQGKVFQYSGGLKEISRNGLKWWFAKYLPSQLLAQFPEFELKDNILKGVAAVLTYDNLNDILYVCKKDYRLKDEYVGKVVYDKDNVFKRGNAVIYLGNPAFFDDASFTISYDVKSGAWISFHDWHPDFVLASKKHFMTVKNRGIWKHNDRCDLFCNFYTTDYPFEIEFVSSTGQQVSTLKNIEYQVECYKYDKTCQDKNHILDWNFDRAVVHNSEQISGDLKLVLRPKNDPLTILDYPIVKTNNIDILFSKEENKYRFNQFWDITRNRGEYKENYQPMWQTAANGYVRTINELYVLYSKSPVQHKRFRHYLNKVLLKRTKSEDVKMLFRLSNEKLTQSFR